MLSASESPPEPLTRGFAPGPHWGHSPRLPLYARAPAIAMSPHSQIASDVPVGLTDFGVDVDV